MIHYRSLENSDALMSNLIGDIERLLAQLNRRTVAMTLDHFTAVVHHSDLVAAFTEDGKAVGMATLAPQYLPSGMGGRVEDVVVSVDHAGKGVGYGLLKKIIEKAGARKMLVLTAPINPAERATNELFRKFGFVPDITGNFRLVLSP